MMTGFLHPTTSAPLLERILCPAGDASVLASRAGRSALDISAPPSRPAADPP
jgi:hypothetical protein